MVAAAIVASGVITAGAGMMSTQQAGSAARSATQAGAQAGRQAIRQTTNTGIRDITSGTNAAIKQENKAVQPYSALGSKSVGKLETLLGLTKGGQGAALKALESTPGYKFAEQQGDQGTINAATATGMNMSGNTLEALSKFNQGLATSTFNTEVGNLESAAGLGESAAMGAAGVDANLLSGAGAEKANLLSNEGTGIANVSIGQGTNEANIGMAEAASNSAAISSAGNDFMLAAMMNNKTPQQGDVAPTDYYNVSIDRFKPCRN